MRRAALLLTVAALMSVATMSSAAAGPVREPLPLPPQIVLDGVLPDFRIVADIQVNTPSTP
jgi:hypothetical protein